MRHILSLVMMFLLGSCSLAENIKEKEGKDYYGEYIPNVVEYHDSATLQRLEEFYQTDPIDYNYLKTIYKGTLLNRTTDVKLHWEKARELALTEWKFQREERGWETYDISERPKLVLDKNNNKFYRYYEFFVLKNNVLKGSIVIPAYKKIENFFTTEIRVYNADQITFESFSTKWGEFAASQFPEVKIEKGSNVDLAFDDIYDEILKINKITEYDIYYKQISEELTNKKLLPVQGATKSEILNIIDHETTVKFSNNIEIKYFAPYILGYNSGGCGTGSGCGNNSVHPIYDDKKNTERENKSRETVILRRNEIVAREQKKYYSQIEEDINKNIARQMADENFEKEKIPRRKEFLDKTKIAYEKSVYIWHTNFFVEMAHNTAQQDIADGYAILLWDELENEENINIRLNPALVGFGVGAVVSGLGSFVYQLSSGKTLDNIDWNSVLKDSFQGGIIGSLAPLGTPVAIVVDLSFTIAGATIGGLMNHVIPSNPDGEIGTTVTGNFLAMFSPIAGGTIGNSIFHITVPLRIVIEKFWNNMTKQKARQHLSGQKIEKPSAVEEKSGYPTPDESMGGGTGTGNGSGSGSGSLGPGGVSRPSGSGGGCINSNHSASNSSGHNYRSACIYEWS